jgi:hypothetical protein
MKHLYLLAIFVIATATLNAQSHLPTDFQKFINPEKSNNPKELAEKQHIDFSFIKNIKDTYWSMDSNYYYNGNGGDWELGYRWKFLSSEVNGNTSTSSYIRHFWNETNQGWVNKDTILITSNGLELQYLERPWNSQSQDWADTSNYYRMDENNNTIISIYRGWDYSANEITWGFKEMFTYDENGIKTDKLWYNWDLNLNTWVYNSHYTFNYDGNGNLTETLRQDWDTQSNEWVNYNLQLYTYDENNNEIQHIQQNWDSDFNAWVNGGKYTYTYDENEIKTEEFFQFWDSGTNDWVNGSLSFFTYDGEGNLTQWFNQQWNGEIEDWVDNFINTFTYNENGALLLIFGQYWNVEAGEWINSSQTFNAYNENGNMIENYSQIWDELTNEWSNSWKYDYFWSEHEINAIANNPGEPINIYPNPTQGKIKINVNSPLQNTSVRVFSVSGELLKTILLKSQNEIDISDFQKGVYFLHFQSQKGDIVRKVIKG